MRVFSNCLEMVKEIERELFEQGITNHPSTMQDKWVGDDCDYETKELIGFTYTLTSYEDMESMFSFFPKDIKENGLEYCEKEFQERIGPPTNPGTSWRVRDNLWRKFLDAEGKFSYTYSERIDKQLGNVLYNIDTSIGSRQNIIAIYNPSIDSDRIGGLARIPCSMYYQFLPRSISGQRVMYMIYTMRSCDFLQHFPIDVYLALKMLIHVAKHTKHLPGIFMHHIGSLHMYRKDYRDRHIF